MTEKQKRFAGAASLIGMGVALMTAFFVLVGWAGRALAQGSATEAPNQDPVSLIVQFYEFIRTGRGTMAVGIGAIILVWLARSVLGRWVGWFKTMAGGYVLGFSIAGLEYFSVAVLADAELTVSLLLNALGAAFVASGGWETLRDLISKTNRPVVTSATVASLMVALMLAPSCKPPGPVIASAVVDCISADRDKVGALMGEFLPIVTGGGANWPVIYQRAKQAGSTIGGCFIAELVQSYLGGVRRLPEDPTAIDTPGWEARAYLELFRNEEAGGASFKTEHGAL